jgi:hypothetical protein
MRRYFEHAPLAILVLALAAWDHRPKLQAQDGPSLRSADDPFAAGPAYPGDPASRIQRQLAQGDHELTRKSQQLATQYGAAKDEDKKSQLRSQLRETLEKQFQLQEQRRAQELAQIEQRLKSLRELMQKRKDARNEIIDRRLDQLLRDAEGLGWTAPSTGGSSSRTPNVLSLPTPQYAPPPVQR